MQIISTMDQMDQSSDDDMKTPLSGKSRHITYFQHLNLYLTSATGICTMVLNNTLPHNSHVFSFFKIPNTIQFPSTITRHENYFRDNQKGIRGFQNALYNMLPIVMDLIHDNKPIIIHCYAGASRSVAFVVAIMMMHDKMNLRNINNPLYYIDLIKSMRIDPHQPQRHLIQTDVNDVFMNILDDYYRTLL